MWNNGFFILWSHISHLYHDDLESGLKLVNKLTSDHINLTPYSVMRVRLAAQVLSETVGNVLNHFGPPEAAGTAEFCLMMDTFFDCLNIRNIKEHELKKKPNLRPYESPDDRFEWLDTYNISIDGKNRLKREMIPTIALMRDPICLFRGKLMRDFK